MKISVVILAGGVGSRMKADRPKQFLEIDGVPVIVYTLNNFQKNSRIDTITVVCLKDWITYFQEIISTYKLTKVTNIVEGGTCGHDSTRNGIFSLRNNLDDDDLVVIHDAARPLIPQLVIDNMIDVAMENGNACTAIPCYDTVIKTDDKISGIEQIDRNSFLRVQTPQAYKYGMIYNLYKRAEEDNKHDFVYANTMAIHYGQRIFFSKGFTSNIKITNPEDIAFYKALKDFDEEVLMK